ncbi:hypothetical protein PISMIDRAFT_19763 [Pisolithus microcarpus 441]|uniref:Uncharacterized protein n=1 Tax=Pisolithus microcarpus 441 TaxID=765257 RepID=A0A0C9YLF7_9AGAM|nr:hypothetical protein PISMIDRAFT_19763 [Pisolithus microcarpus 441]
MDGASLTEQVDTHLDLTTSESATVRPRIFRREYDDLSLRRESAKHSTGAGTYPCGEAEYSKILISVSTRTVDLATMYMVLMYILAKSTVTVVNFVALSPEAGVIDLTGGEDHDTGVYED